MIKKMNSLPTTLCISYPKFGYFSSCQSDGMQKLLSGAIMYFKKIKHSAKGWRRLRVCKKVKVILITLPAKCLQG